MTKAGFFLIFWALQACNFQTYDLLNGHYGCPRSQTYHRNKFLRLLHNFIILGFLNREFHSGLECSVRRGVQLRRDNSLGIRELLNLNLNNNSNNNKWVILKTALASSFAVKNNHLENYFEKYLLIYQKKLVHSSTDSFSWTIRKSFFDALKMLIFV